MKSIGIRLRVFLAMTAVIAGLLVLTYWTVEGLVDRFLEAEIANSLGRARRAYASFTAVRDEVLLDQARSVAQVPHLRAVLDTPDVDQPTVGYTIENLSKAPLLFVTDAEGRMLADSRPDAVAPEVSGMPGVERALQGKEYLGIWHYAGEPFLVAISPVTLDSTVLGLLGLGYPLQGRAADLHSVTGLDVTILRGDDVLATAWSEAPGEGEPAAPEARHGSAWSGVPTLDHVRLAIDEREYMATAIALEPDGVRLVLSRPLDHVLIYFQRAKAEILWIGLAIAGLGLLVSQWISTRIARPIRDLTDAANALARGDLSTEVRVRTEDEIGVLGRAFNAMARQLEALMQKAMQKAQAAEQASDAKSVFLATMSHEIRTPLNGVLGFAEQLLDTDLSREQREYVQVVQRSGDDLLAIINDILDFSKIEAGQMRLEQLELHLSTCLRRAVDSVRPTIEAKGLELAIAIDPGVPERLIGPASRIRQIVLNYVANAAKFTAQGSITIHASLVSETETDAVVKIAVRDTGIGIPLDRLDRLFKPFSQVDSGANREYAGTGLGLAICKDLAELMEGDVGVESEVGRGSVFWFTARLAKQPAQKLEPASEPRSLLPARPAVESPPPREPHASDPEQITLDRRKRQRILVAEDNRINQRMTAVVLSKAGWSHALAENGSQAVQMALAEPFDLVLMDCQMPAMDGFEATRRIRESESGRHVPIVALTANTLEGDREACLAAGMDDFLGKPFKAAALVAMIERWIGSPAVAETAGERVPSVSEAI